MWASLSGLFLLLLVSLFLSLAIEPGVNRLAARGWRRGTATAVILVGVFLGFLVFLVAIGTLVGQQIAELLGNSEKYVTRTVNFLNDKFDTQINAAGVIESINDENGPVQRFIRSQQGKVVDLSVTALGVLVQGCRCCCSRSTSSPTDPSFGGRSAAGCRPDQQRSVLSGWELAIDKTGGYLYSRALLAGLSAFFHWVVFQAIGIQAPVAMALWVGLISQFLPVVGTYVAGALPVLVQFVDSPPKALILLIFVLLYQQVENYFLLATDHRPDDGPASGDRVRVGDRRWRSARCRRRRAGDTGGGDGPSGAQQRRPAPRGRRQPPHRPKTRQAAVAPKAEQASRQARWRHLSHSSR